jgi:nitrite reductase (NADH) large subunit
VERLGIDAVRRLLVDEAEPGLCARLDEEVERAVSSFRDPWLEAEQPVHPAQFQLAVSPE